MSGASKILTVSYGTFSCTLEGFDAPLETMKAIAEYFRELSARDRQFGAEPQIIDPETLVRIASNETDLPIEAEVDINGVRLRPSKGITPVTPTTDKAEAEEITDNLESTAETLRMPITEYDDAQDDALAGISPMPENPVLETEPVPSESIAAKLRRIRTVVAAKQAASTATVSLDDTAATNDTRTPIENNASDTETDDTSTELLFSGADNSSEQIDLSAPLLLQSDDMEDDLLQNRDMSISRILDTVEDSEDDNIEEATSEQLAPLPLTTKQRSSPPAPTPEMPIQATPSSQPSADFDIRNAVQSILGNTDLPDDPENDPANKLTNTQTGKDTPAANYDINTAVRSKRRKRAVRGEAALSRLLNETNAKLETTESHRRQSAISHLRAAVAATVADRKLDLGDMDNSGDGAEPYRSALADVVQPTKPVAGNKGKAPLVLDAGYRIGDGNTVHPVTPSNPVTDNKDNLIDDSGDFAKFIQACGAVELPDLLEAAAAYATYIKDLPHFARPQIMRLVTNYTGKDEFNREEGLRAFGQLLRQGRIAKIQPGKFAVSQTTRFKPAS